MTEIGPQLELAEVTEFTEDQSWVLVADDETVIAVDHNGDEADVTPKADDDNEDVSSSSDEDN